MVNGRDWEWTCSDGTTTIDCFSHRMLNGGLINGVIVLHGQQTRDIYCVLIGGKLSFA